MKQSARVVAAVLSIVMGTVIAGCAGPTPPPGVPPIVYPPIVSVTPDNWNGNTLAIVIDTALYTDNLTISGLNYIVYDQNSTVIFSGPAGTGSPVGGVVITVSYEDVSTPGKINAGDKFHVTVTTGAADAAQGGTFEANANNDNIVSVSI